MISNRYQQFATCALPPSKTIDALILIGAITDHSDALPPSKIIDALSLMVPNNAFSRPIDLGKKSKIYLQQLKNPLAARGRLDGYNKIVNYDQEHWIFQAAERDPQFQAINCKKCGEYQKVSRNVHVPAICMCKCAI
jgi:hypothetical protein